MIISILIISILIVSVYYVNQIFTTLIRQSSGASNRINGMEDFDKHVYNNFHVDEKNEHPNEPLSRSFYYLLFMQNKKEAI